MRGLGRSKPIDGAKPNRGNFKPTSHYTAKIRQAEPQSRKFQAINIIVKHQIRERERERDLQNQNPRTTQRENGCQLNGRRWMDIYVEPWVWPRLGSGKKDAWKAVHAVSTVEKNVGIPYIERGGWVMSGSYVNRPLRWWVALGWGYGRH